MSKTKVCSSCNKRKRLEAFSKHSRNKDGLRSECRECCKEWQANYHKARKEAAPNVVYVLKLDEAEVYVGSTTYPLDKRIAEHRSDLNLGKHGNQELQALYASSSAKMLEIETLTTAVSEDEARSKEGWWIRCYKDKGRNIVNRKSSVSFGQAQEIREMFLTGQYSVKDLSVIYGCDAAHISAIVNNKYHKDDSYDPAPARSLFKESQRRNGKRRGKNSTKLHPDNYQYVYYQYHQCGLTQQQIATMWDVSRTTIGTAIKAHKESHYSSPPSKY